MTIIQEALRNLPATKSMSEIHEKRRCPIAEMLRWDAQRPEWKKIRDEIMKPR